MEQLPDWRGRARQTIIGLYLSSQNMDGLSLEIEDIWINMPFEDLSDKEDIDSDDEKDKWRALKLFQSRMHLWR